MADDRAYRVIVGYEAEKQTFFARVPELDIHVTGATRADVLTDAEHAIEQQIAARATDNQPVPEPIDATVPSGKLSLELGAELHKELLHHARASGLSAEALAAQLVARALGTMEGSRGRFRRPQPTTNAPAGAPAEARGEGEEPGDEQPKVDPRAAERGRDDRAPRDDRGNRGGRGGGGGRSDDRGGNRRQREGYRPELDDKANFLEYLRGLEKGGGQGGGGRGRR